MSKADKAERAQQAIDSAYEQDARESQVVDLLTDLMHLCKKEKLSFNALLGSAKMHFAEEK